MRVREEPAWAPAVKDRRRLGDLVEFLFSNHGVHLRNGAAEDPRAFVAGHDDAACAPGAGSPAGSPRVESAGGVDSWLAGRDLKQLKSAGSRAVTGARDGGRTRMA